MARIFHPRPRGGGDQLRHAPALYHSIVCQPVLLQAAQGVAPGETRGADGDAAGAGGRLENLNPMITRELK
jgi:hypothetical protein